MSTLINSTRIALLLLSGAGFYGTWYLLMNNGTTEHMTKIRDVGPRLLPGTNVPLKTTYVGIEAIDYQLTVLTLFFWEFVDGSRPDASLFCYHFAGQVFSGWSLLVIESLRKGNLGIMVSFIAIWGIALQNLAYAVIVPIYLIMHLSSSPTVRSRNAADYMVNVSDTLSVPITTFLAYAVPTVLMSLSAPVSLDFSSKQTLMAFWQFFPLWISMLQPIVAFVIAAIANDRNAIKENTPSPKVSLKSLRFVYIVLLIAAGVNQISTMSIVALSEFFPGLFAPGYVGVFNFSKVFLPQAITPATKMPTIGDGAFMLVQYDEAIGSFSIALWAAVLLAQAYQNNDQHAASYVRLAFHGILALALTGPLGFAVACVWVRDELVLENGIVEKKEQ